jgi:D-tyrosyl-tRNA(Tyr) deacylase
MRLVLQRVSRASVEWTEDGTLQTESIGPGFAILVGAGAADTQAEIARLARKVAEVRVFADDTGRSNLSLTDIGGSALVVSQFTLYADFSRGRRPSFIAAGQPGIAAERYESFATALREVGVPVKQGRFGASMLVNVQNQGPVTFVLSTDEWETRV